VVGGRAAFVTQRVALWSTQVLQPLQPTLDATSGILAAPPSEILDLASSGDAAGASAAADESVLRTSTDVAPAAAAPFAPALAGVTDQLYRFTAAHLVQVWKVYHELTKGTQKNSRRIVLLPPTPASDAAAPAPADDIDDAMAADEPAPPTTVLDAALRGLPPSFRVLNRLTRRALAAILVRRRVAQPATHGRMC